jgi:hypothetical protein
MPTDKTIVPATGQPPESSLVERSEVTPGLPYNEYKGSLREDFLWACAYCTISEYEAQAIRMTIDHYEPQKVRPDLVNSYENLMYCCDDCNVLKGDRCPPEAARVDGHRFFRPDKDYRHENFQKGLKQTDIYLDGRTNVGKFTIEFLDLNRATLLRLRKIRERLANCHQHVLNGVLGLRRFPIDRLPPSVRGMARRRIEEWTGMSVKFPDEIDKVLRGIAYSPMVDSGPEKEKRAAARTAKQRYLDALYPGESWRARGRTRNRKRR